MEPLQEFQKIYLEQFLKNLRRRNSGRLTSRKSKRYPRKSSAGPGGNLRNMFQSYSTKMLDLNSSYRQQNEISSPMFEVEISVLTQSFVPRNMDRTKIAINFLQFSIFYAVHIKLFIPEIHPAQNDNILDPLVLWYLLRLEPNSSAEPCVQNLHAEETIPAT